ncbi:hypothetical protein OPV22_033233 [Ensete ventricosum]|uniref:Uncharacterized protein n=1 Tax=Ensete ventricosum TaxID=4639 RepID=A0AAV8PPG2_ENSVE|nr:hypothetical protein OPV22_033233 [Ensete ventricosum]
MAPKKKKKNRGRGSNSKTQPGSSSAAVPSPPQDSPPATTELHDETATSQEPISSAVPESATPASPPAASVGLRSRSQGQEEEDERGAGEADPQTAALADSVDNMTVNDERDLRLLLRGLSSLGSTFPELKSMTRELQGSPDNQDSQELMVDLTQSLEAVANIFGGYTNLVKRTVRTLQQERSDRRGEDGGSSGGGGGSGTAGGGDVYSSWGDWLMVQEICSSDSVSVKELGDFLFYCSGS